LSGTTVVLSCFFIESITLLSEEEPAFSEVLSPAELHANNPVTRHTREYFNSFILIELLSVTANYVPSGEIVFLPAIFSEVT
jgi:hypothetical protein